MASHYVMSRLARALLHDVILHVSDVTAGRGRIIDWRTVKSGEVVLDNADAFDVAYRFVALVGADKALASLAEWEDGEPVETAPPTKVSPCITAFAPQACGGRRRAFDVDGFRVMVEPHSDDAAQAAFLRPWPTSRRPSPSHSTTFCMPMTRMSWRQYPTIATN
jgi:hypothetical protein